MNIFLQIKQSATSTFHENLQKGKNGLLRVKLGYKEVVVEICHSELPASCSYKHLWRREQMPLAKILTSYPPSNASRFFVIVVRFHSDKKGAHFCEE